MAKALLIGLMSIKEIRCSTAAFDCTHVCKLVDKVRNEIL